MPLDEEFGPHIYSSLADLCNVRLMFIYPFLQFFSLRQRKRVNLILFLYPCITCKPEWRAKRIKLHGRLIPESFRGRHSDEG